MTPDEGSGFLITFPDFNECFSDGGTIEEAIENGMDALRTAIFALTDLGHPVPAPMSGGFSGRFVTRIPRSLHGQLAFRAKQEGVSLNALVTTYLAKGIGRSTGA
ncbi:MAG: toxin-antitoxin system HicB family antitoxin [Magnetococcales bacterium]|nr:toxin-antitoxin system HicB family antitoxin [Magnetococcales bacterium]